MRKAISSDQMYRIEENGHTGLGMRRFLMMENAGHGLADFIVAKFKGKLKNKPIVAVCGTGNNGGDGFVASRHLAGYGARITIILLGSPSDIKSEEAKLNWGIVEKMRSIEILFGADVTAEVKGVISRADIILDAVFGTGIRGDIREPHASALRAINANRGAYVLAVDVPSGIDPNTGRMHDNCVRADATVTFHRAKIGLPRARKHTGPVHVEWIGIPPEAEEGVV